ncbi:MAG: glutamate--tRNA ligase [Patescibacteria group bacterium]
MEVRVRLAPSPTGAPHIGTVWQALFNFVFAKKNNGKFILRLEDTDRERYVPESVNQIYETLNWLELNFDEGPNIGGPFGPYVQSERLNIYKKHADELLAKGLAYKEDGAVRFKTKKDGETSWHELIGSKDISFPNNTQEDFIILKSDGYPTYNFANVIDDHLMEITHVIRGNEFISSTPKHLMIYQAFGWSIPQFAHLPVLVGSDRAKLSKRHGAKSALEFRDDGYLKAAVLNFLALLGWSHPNGKEIFDLEEMIQLFDFKDFNLASPIFDTTKLDWLNGEYIRKTQNSKLKTQILEYLKDLSGGALDRPTEAEVERVIPLIKERIKKLSDFIPLTDFLWEKPEYEKEVFLKLIKSDVNLSDVLSEILNSLEALKKPWEANEFEKAFRELAGRFELSDTQMFQLIRVAISGQTVTPPLFECIEILGEEETYKRIKEVAKIIGS